MDMTLGTWRVSIQRIPPTSAELAALYNHAARYWQGALRRLGFLHAYADLFARLEDDGALGGLQHGARALDCGIGPAAFSLALAEQLGTPVRIAGIDIAPQMLDQAQHTLDAAGVPAELRCADVCELPFADQLFDLVVSAYMLEHLGDPRAGLREMARVLRPGAALLLVVTRRGIGGALLGLKYRNAAIDPAALASWMENAGLADVRQYDITAGPSVARWMSVACVGRKPAQ
jgi:demethylmenaquinone methyltransferase/2-methoxy-6-polyprenyl-1,4-benzoquinol methylase